MKEAEAIELLSARWNTMWPTLQPAVPSSLENEAWRPPDNTAYWAAAFIRHTTSQQLTQGAEGKRRFERKGNIIVMLFADVDQGRGGLSLLVDRPNGVRAIFEGKRLALVTDPLWIGAAASAEGGKNGKTTDGRWFQQNVQLPFRYYDIA